VVILCLTGIISLWALWEVFSLLTRRAYHKVAITTNTSALLATLSQWNDAGQPAGEALDILLSLQGSYRPFLFTNTVRINGTDYRCQFAIRDSRFRENGVLAITSRGTILWLSEKGNALVQVRDRE
jgi:hypothetical protein